MTGHILLLAALPLLAMAADTPDAPELPEGKVVTLPMALIQRLLDDNTSLRQSVIQLERERDEARSGKRDCEESRGV